MSGVMQSETKNTIHDGNNNKILSTHHRQSNLHR